jgi:hypothetical protein
MIAPCNITPNNTIEFTLEGEIICVRYKCGKIKWRKTNVDKNTTKTNR